MSASSLVSIDSELLSFSDVQKEIDRGQHLIIAGDETVLSELPSGNWIAGTIPYFMAETGGQEDREKLFVHTVNGTTKSNPPRMMAYSARNISRIASDAPEHGFTVVIIPAASEVHQVYAENAPDFPNMFFSPIIGWVSGVHLNDLETASAKTAFGATGGMMMEHQAVAMHIPLPKTQIANINIVNLFKEGKGSEIRFQETGFSVEDCLIDGEEVNFAEYIEQQGIDTRLPLVADYSGVKVNVSIQSVNQTKRKVDLYAPVFADVTYHFADPVADYVGEFDRALPSKKSKNIAFSCNCILNYLYSELEGKKTGSVQGPITFGEIAYQLVNQTLVYLTLATD